MLCSCRLAVRSAASEHQGRGVPHAPAPRTPPAHLYHHHQGELCPLTPPLSLSPARQQISLVIGKLTSQLADLMARGSLALEVITADVCQARWVYSVR